MKDINKIHEEVFTLLHHWSGDERTSKLRTFKTVNKGKNPYFYMRSVRDERFKNGYWFPGNDSYLCISFWAGGDSINKTPNIYFEIHEKYGCRLIITAKDSEPKFTYFKHLIEYLNQKIEGDKGVFKTNLWIKHLNFDSNSWSTALYNFLISEKAVIDDYILENQYTEIEEFISGFGLIDQSDFDKMLTRVLKEQELIASEKRIKQKFIDNPNFLPVSLSGIQIENFQGVISTSLNGLPHDARWIFITGENGYGKTTILQALALGLYKDSALDEYLDTDTRIAAEVWEENRKTFYLKSRPDFIGGILPVAGYGPSRLNIQSEASENDDFKSRNPVLGLFQNETLLKNINYELFATKHADRAAFSDLEKIIRTVTSGRIDTVEVDRRDVLFYESLPNGDLLEPLPLSQLAAGFRSVINIVFDIYLRLRSYHGEEMNFTDFYGIVLIDEIENHLHPILQRELPITLSEVFPKIQFIVTTHSPIPLLAADKKSVILTIHRNRKDGVTIERLDESINFPTLLPNAILTSPIFGFTNILPQNKDSSEFIRSEDTYQEVLKNDKQKSLIDSHLSDETTKEILKLLKKD